MTQLTHYTYSKRCVVIDHRNRGLEPSQPISIMGREIRSPAPSQHAAADLCLHGSGENENAEKSSPRFSSPPAAVPVGLETMGAITVSCSQPSPPHHQGPSPRRAPDGPQWVTLRIAKLVDLRVLTWCWLTGQQPLISVSGL